MGSLVNLTVVEGSIAVITLNRADAANAMSKTLLDELNAIIEKVNDDTAIHCTIITGTGEKAFCAGADLKERRGMSDVQVISAVQYIGKTVTKIAQMKMPVIAALNGAAFGGGLELALACDFRIAASHTKLGLTETSLAIIPGAGGTQRLSRLVGIGQAKRLIFTAKPIEASEALRIGLVEQIAPIEDLFDIALETAKKIAGNGPIALCQAKKAIDQGIQTDISTGLEIEHVCYKTTIPTRDRQEGLAAFKEKRKPIYQGK